MKQCLIDLFINFIFLSNMAITNFTAIEKQIAFIKEIDKIKYILRKTKLFNNDRNENDAEHSWHLALIAIVLAEHSDEPLDMLKVLKMLLIHVIVEIDAGDVFLYDELC